MTTRQKLRIAAATLAVLLAPVAGLNVYLLARDGDDPGVLVCKRSAELGGDYLDALNEVDELDMLKKSRHEDLRTVAARIEGSVTDRDGLTDLHTAVTAYVAACERHGVTIPV